MKEYSTQIKLDKTQIRALSYHFSSEPAVTDRTVYGVLLFLGLFRLKRILESGLDSPTNEATLDFNYEELTALYYWANTIDAIGIEMQSNGSLLYARAVADKIINEMPQELIQQLH